MLTVTFYSFRGGVGRTLALVNTAYILAEKGLKVFLVDFDLEAPGLSFMPEVQPGKGKEPKSKIGLMGFLQKAIDLKPTPQIKDLAYQPVICEGKKPDGSKRLRGEIHVLPVGNLEGEGKEYKLEDLKLRKLYADKERAVTIDDLKVQIQQYYDPDYVLVDSRTGLTETGGICTTHMADFVVALTALTDQHIAGMEMVVKRLIKAKPEIKNNILFVASPVPYGEEELKKERIDKAKRQLAKALGTKAEYFPGMLTIPYHPRLALTEENFMAKFPDSPLALAYQNLTKTIRQKNPDDLHYRYEQQVIDLFKHNDRKAIENLEKIVRFSNAPADALNLYAILLSLADDPKSRSPETYLLRAIEASPDNPDPLVYYAAFLTERKRFREADDFYKKAIYVSPNNTAILGNYAVFLGKQSRPNEAEQFYKKALEADPKDARNLGNYALFLQGQERFKEAEHFYKKALEADPKHANNLGNYAFFLYKVHNDLKQALEYTEKALEMLPSEAWPLLCNKALFLLLLGQEKKSREIYQKALGHIPSDEEFVRCASSDLKEATAKHPGNAEIPEMLKWIEAKWKELHPGA